MKTIDEKIKEKTRELEALKQERDFPFDNWYVSTVNKNWLVYYQGRCTTNYGVNMAGEWQWNNLGSATINKWKKAPTQAIQKKLTMIAVQKGFKPGVEFKSALNNGVVRKFEKDQDIKYDRKTNRLYLGDTPDGGVIFSKGVWSEIIDDTPVIDGYEMAYNETNVHFGCYTFEHKWVEDLLETMDCMGLDAVSTDEHVVEYEDIAKVVKYIKKRKNDTK